MHARYKAIITLTYLFLLVTVLALAPEDVSSLDLEDPSLVLKMKLIQVMSVTLLFIFPTIIFTLAFNHNKLLEPLRLNAAPNISILALIIIMMISLFPFIGFLEQLNSHMSLPSFLSGVEAKMRSWEENAGKLTQAFTKMNSVYELCINLVVLGVMAGLAEELFFRGLLQPLMIAWTKNKHTGIWITAILFSAMHLQFYGFLPRMVLGALMGYVFLWSGSLWVPVFTHFFHNGFSIFLKYLFDHHLLASDPDKLGADLSFTIIASFSMVIFLLRLIYKREAGSPKIRA